MDVGVMMQVLSPGVQNRDDTDLGTRVAWVGGDVGARFQQVGGEAVAQRVHRHPLGQARGLAGGTAGSMQDLRIYRPALVVAGEEPLARPCQAPVAPQDRQKLRRQHGIVVLGALACPLRPGSSSGCCRYR
jgi:hypothetical protein